MASGTTVALEIVVPDRPAAVYVMFRLFLFETILRVTVEDFAEVADVFQVRRVGVEGNSLGFLLSM